MTEPVNAGGQAQADSSGTTAAAPAQVAASVGQAQTTGNGSGAVAEESFFDPRSIEGKPELQSAYKQMQGEFTKRLQKFRGQEQDLQLVAQFRANPEAMIRSMAQQYGLQLIQGGQQQDTVPKDFNPQSWDEVEQHFRQKWEKEALNPLANEVRQLKKQNIEQFLDSHHSDWRTYEDAMMDTLRKHPTLVNDPSTLYRMSVPSSVVEGRAMSAAMEKLKASTAAASVSGAQTTKPTTTAPTGPLTFAQAAERAKAELAARGFRPPS